MLYTLGSVENFNGCKQVSENIWPGRPQDKRFDEILKSCLVLKIILLYSTSYIIKTLILKNLS